VHNGIEYADMQFIAEAYDLLRTVGGMANDHIGATLEAWNGAELESFLVEITAKVLRKIDDREGAGGGFLVDKIVDQARPMGAAQAKPLPRTMNCLQNCLQNCRPGKAHGCSPSRTSTSYHELSSKLSSKLSTRQGPWVQPKPNLYLVP
jgi:hypothetical protein